jgi:pimeloyl-ACP methyl ester carboxylesterase
MGLSTPVTAATVEQQGTTQQQADYLKLFRADSAVKDLEAIRKCLTADYPDEKKKWSVMGQSYGGFVALSYLSKFPEGLREVFTFGGLAPVSQRRPDEVVRRLMGKVEERNKKFYAKFPEDRERVKRVVEFLKEKKGVVMADGGIMTPERFMAMGNNFGAHGGFDRVHDAILRAANDLDLFGLLTRPTLSKIVSQGLPFDEHPIYAVLHEAIYCQGEASKWAFSRLRDDFPKFSIDSQEEELFFTGEMVFRSDFDSHSELQSLAPVSNILAEVPDWSDLYDLDQLKRNEVPLYAATYMDDMYVDFDFAQETAGLVNGCKTYVTNTMYHDAIRSKTEKVMKPIFALRDDSID